MLENFEFLQEQATAWPIFNFVEEPTETIFPIASKPQSKGGIKPGVYFPAVKFTSLALIPIYKFFTTTSSWFGFGIGTVTIFVTLRKSGDNSVTIYF